MSGVTSHGIRYPDGASKAKNLGPELKQMAEDIDNFIDDQIDPTGPLRDVVEAVAESVMLSTLGLARCMHFEAGRWWWDGPNSPAATHFLLRIDGRWATAQKPFPTPSATSPAITWI